jgi:hypothetical protein
MKHAATERAACIHQARVYLAQARVRRGSTFHATLLKWAANARRRAMPVQGGLFA